MGRQQRPVIFLRLYLPETCRVNASKGFLVLVVACIGPNAQGGVSGCTAGDNVVLVLVVDEIFVVVAAHIVVKEYSS